MRRALVIGSNGQIGRELLGSLRRSKVETLGADIDGELSDTSRIDVRDPVETKALIQAVRPDIVFLCAAIADVEGCEREPTTTFQTNVLGTYHVCAATSAVGARFVFFSTDYVFDGMSGPYEEADPPNPLNEYGRQKLIGEVIATRFAPEALIVRTTVVYGWERKGKNFVQRTIASLRAGRTVHVASDQLGTPTWSRNLADAVVESVEKGVHGILNLAGPERVSRYDFALEVARTFRLDSGLLVPASTTSLGQAAKRPLAAGLRVERARTILSTRLLGYQEGLRSMAAEEQAGGEGGCAVAN